MKCKVKHKKSRIIQAEQMSAGPVLYCDVLTIHSVSMRARYEQDAMLKMAPELEAALIGKILMLTLTKCQIAKIIELMTIIKATSCGS